MHGNLAATGIIVLLQFAAFSKFPFCTAFLASNLLSRSDFLALQDKTLVKFILLADLINKLSTIFQHRRTLSFYDKF